MSNSWEEEVLTSQARCESKVSNRPAAMQECSFPRLFHWAKPSVSLRTLKCEGWEPAVAVSGTSSCGWLIWGVDGCSPSNRKDTSQLSEILPVNSKAQDRKVRYLLRCKGLPQPCLFHVTTGLYLSCFMPQLFTLKHRANPTSPSLECCHEDKGCGCLAARAKPTCNPSHE